jgi:tetratricopeptide (TPR) repeat protein
MKNRQNLIRLTSTALMLVLASMASHAKSEAIALAQPELTSEFVYKYLVGEVAGQRGDIALASALFYDLAKSSRDPRMAERATRAAAYGNLQQQAISSASLWAELDPESTEAQQAISQMLLGSGNLNDAQPYLKKLLAEEETRASGFMYLNSALARYPDKETALKLVQELAKPYPNLAEAHLTVAHSAWIAGKDELALKELKIAEGLRPDWELAAMLHGEILQQKSQDEAIAFYRRFTDQHPDANDTRLAYAKLLVNKQQLKEARVQFEKLSKVAKDNPDMAIVVGLLAGQLGDFAQADTYFQQALERGFKDPEQVYIYLGQSAEKQNKDEQALSWYRRVEGGELYFDAQLRVASVLAHQNKLDEARALLHSIPDLDSEQQAGAIQMEAHLLAQAKRYDEAYAMLENAVNTLPNTPDIIYDYAMMAEKVQRFDVMEQQLRKLIQLKPDFAQAYNALGYTLADRNERLGEATKLIEKALALSPNDYYILDSMGWVQYRLGKLDKAADYLRRAYTAQTDPEIAAHLGEVLWQQGNRDEAIKTWDEALRKHPDNEALLNTTKKFRP